MAFIKVHQVSKEFSTVRALDNLSFEFQSGAHYAIRGASGSGKSTLLYLIGGLDRPSSGKIFVEDSNLSDLTDEKLAHYRNRFVGFVFQFHFLLPTMTAFDNILLPSRIGSLYNEKLKKDLFLFAKYLEVDHCLEKYPYELSGGEQQRINIIRALSLRPKLLLCDEPTGNLDSHNAQKVTGLIRDLALETKATLIIVTHDEKVAQSFDISLMMRDGKIFAN